MPSSSAMSLIQMCAFSTLWSMRSTRVMVIRSTPGSGHEDGPSDRVCPVAGPHPWFASSAVRGYADALRLATRTACWSPTRPRWPEQSSAGLDRSAALRERGVKAPAQAMYDLQLAGYTIDRVGCTDRGGRRTFGYRLHGPPAATDVQSHRRACVSDRG